MPPKTATEDIDKPSEHDGEALSDVKPEQSASQVGSTDVPAAERVKAAIAANSDEPPVKDTTVADTVESAGLTKEALLELQRQREAKEAADVAAEVLRFSQLPACS